MGTPLFDFFVFEKHTCGERESHTSTMPESRAHLGMLSARQIPQVGERTASARPSPRATKMATAVCVAAVAGPTAHWARRLTQNMRPGLAAPAATCAALRESTEIKKADQSEKDKTRKIKNSTPR